MSIYHAFIDTFQKYLPSPTLPGTDIHGRTHGRHGVHAKLTGAGGGGCAFALLHPSVIGSKVRCDCESIIPAFWLQRIQISF